MATESTESMAMDAGPQAERTRRLATQTARVFPPTLHVPRGDRPPAVAFSSPPVAPFAATTSTDAAAQGPSVLLPLPQCAPTSACHLQVAQLTEEKQFLTRYVERLLHQLRALLQKHGELERLKSISDPTREITSESGQDGLADRFPSWVTSQEHTSPLFQVYDLKIQDMVRRLAVSFICSSQG
ncbi:hypothetical protein P43SY_000225 [Pythium insidiosum]|uniref:Uncharacterized protein n=1 Tax=Pythium insidiosum TaxID=114742 RepID=A0AAD5LPC3_PYTIN|nr:hypothetical protein P43SY_000225 [Pythium insidiosum]